MSALIHSDPETALRVAEQELGILITVRDLTGTLVDAHGSPLAPGRNSHRRQPACDRGFNQACIEHCRRDVGNSCRTATAPFATTCWKGLREVVVPLRADGFLHGYLFAGAWRAAESPPGPWTTSWRQLPAWDPQRASEIAGLLRLLGAGLLALRGTGGTPPVTRSDQIQTWIRHHLAHASPLPGLARELRLSTSRTSHVVQELFTVSFQELLTRERDAAARQLLSGSELSVAEIGARVGWPDTPHFTRTFHRLNGMPPGRWRLAHQTS